MIEDSRRNIPVGISLPAEMIERIDKERGDITRSRYVLRMIERSLSVKSPDRNHQSVR